MTFSRAGLGGVVLLLSGCHLTLPFQVRSNDSAHSADSKDLRDGSSSGETVIRNDCYQMDLPGPQRESPGRRDQTSLKTDALASLPTGTCADTASIPSADLDSIASFVVNTGNGGSNPAVIRYCTSKTVVIHLHVTASQSYSFAWSCANLGAVEMRSVSTNCLDETSCGTYSTVPSGVLRCFSTSSDLYLSICSDPSGDILFKMQ
jgi:hypothetical protein